MRINDKVFNEFSTETNNVEIIRKVFDSIYNKYLDSMFVDSIQFIITLKSNSNIIEKTLSSYDFPVIFSDSNKEDIIVFDFSTLYIDCNNYVTTVDFKQVNLYLNDIISIDIYE